MEIPMRALTDAELDVVSGGSSRWNRGRGRGVSLENVAVAANLASVRQSNNISGITINGAGGAYISFDQENKSIVVQKAEAEVED
jgi:hypothetical protein